MNKWESICGCVLIISLLVFNTFEVWEKKEVQKECLKAVAVAKGDVKDCGK